MADKITDFQKFATAEKEQAKDVEAMGSRNFINSNLNLPTIVFLKFTKILVLNKDGGEI